MKILTSLSFGVALAAGLALTATAANLSPAEAIGSGTWQSNCLMTLTSGCTFTATGSMTGSPILAGTFTLRVDTGSPTSLNGNPVGNPPGSQQGVCLPGSFAGTLTETGGDTINLLHVGTMCEEAATGSAPHYLGTYRVTGGTGRFAAAAGAGTVVGTFARDTGLSIFYLRGAITY